MGSVVVMLNVSPSISGDGAEGGGRFGWDVSCLFRCGSLLAGGRPAGRASSKMQRVPSDEHLAQVGDDVYLTHRIFWERHLSQAALVGLRMLSVILLDMPGERALGIFKAKYEGSLAFG